MGYHGMRSSGALLAIACILGTKRWKPDATRRTLAATLAVISSHSFALLPLCYGGSMSDKRACENHTILP